MCVPLIPKVHPKCKVLLRQLWKFDFRVLNQIQLEYSQLQMEIREHKKIRDPGLF